MSETYAEGVLTGTSYVREGGNAVVTEDMRQVLGRAPRAYAQWVRDHMEALSGAHEGDAGLVSGLFNTTQVVGGSLGLAVLTTLAASRTERLLGAGHASVAATADGYRLAFAVATGIAAVALVLAAALLRPGNARRDEREPGEQHTVRAEARDRACRQAEHQHPDRDRRGQERRSGEQLAVAQDALEIERADVLEAVHPGDHQDLDAVRAGQRTRAEEPKPQQRAGGTRLRDGLVTRTVYPTVPPKVEYELTPVALELHETLQRLTDWAERNRVYIAESRAAYDVEHKPELLDA